MRYIGIAVLGSLLLWSNHANAQTLDEDVQCLVLSNAFARRGATDDARKVSQLTSAFYLGRVDGRATPDTLKSALLTQHGLPAPAAGKAMQACAARADAANDRVGAMTRQIAPPKK